jgi:hypothetical protein
MQANIKCPFLNPVLPLSGKIKANIVAIFRKISVLKATILVHSTTSLFVLLVAL